MADIGGDALVTSISSAGFMSGLPGVAQGAINSIPVDTLMSNPAEGISKMSEAGITGAVNNIPYAGPALSMGKDAMRLYDKYFGEEPDYSNQLKLKYDFHKWEWPYEFLEKVSRNEEAEKYNADYDNYSDEGFIEPTKWNTHFANKAQKKLVNISRESLWHRIFKLQFDKLYKLVTDEHKNESSSYGPGGNGSPLLTRNNLRSDNQVTGYGHLWAITLDKDGAFSVDNPFKSVHNLWNGDQGLVLSDSLLPATSFRYDTYKAVNETIQLCPGCTIDVPAGFNFQKSITVSIFNDCQNALREWLRQYRLNVIPGFQVVRPYKDCCSKLKLYIYNRQLYPMYIYELYVIPDLNEESISDRGDKSFDLSFNILGEADGQDASY